jgi:hypothetical protein
MRTNPNSLHLNHLHQSTNRQNRKNKKSKGIQNSHHHFLHMDRRRICQQRFCDS